MPQNRVKLLTILFFVVSALDIIGIVSDKMFLQVIFKPLIIISLILLYYFTVEKRNNLYLMALVFSFLGDVFLLDKNNMFLFGIAFFLITQVIFIFIIVRQMEKPSYFHKFLYAFLFVNYVVYLLSLIRPKLGDLFVPVLVYGIVIAVFGLVSTLNYVTKRTTNSLFMMMGSTLFIVSDSMIALDKFHEPKVFYPIAIMISYVLAQYLIYKYMAEESIGKLQRPRAK